MIFKNSLISLVIIQVIGMVVFRVSVVNEVSKLHNLQIHFEEHKAENKDISLVEFFFLHYVAEGSHHHATKDCEHMSLPFKTSQYTSILLATGPLNGAEMNSDSSIDDHLQSNHYADEFVHYSVSLNAFWQPPKA
jgi:hypothetical protein